MDDAAHRVSQFILAQTLVNIAFGALVTAGLYWIGVPYAALWGGLTAVLRFVPFVGTTLSALCPLMLAFATFPGWTETLQTLALFATLDLLTAYFVEPVVLGQRTGVSSFALLVSALFWIWIWGPIGLLLATPLTVCIAVLGRHVRPLRFLAVIFADEPALTPHVRFYQRLLARDEDEANALASQKLAELGPVGLADHVLMPVLAFVDQHLSEDEITQEDAKFVLNAVRENVDALRTASAEAVAGPIVMGIAARTSVDQVLLETLGATLTPTVNMRCRLWGIAGGSGHPAGDRPATGARLRRFDIPDARFRIAQLLPQHPERSADRANTGTASHAGRCRSREDSAAHEGSRRR